MDIVHWNQAPQDVNAALPFSRRRAANMTAAEFAIAAQEARNHGGFVGAIEKGALLVLRPRSRILVCEFLFANPQLRINCS